MLRHSELYFVSALLRHSPVLHEYSFTPFFIRRMLKDADLTRLKCETPSFGGAVVDSHAKTSIAAAVHILYMISAGRLLLDLRWRS
jgi:hypothetical protein